MRLGRHLGQQQAGRAPAPHQEAVAADEDPLRHGRGEGHGLRQGRDLDPQAGQLVRRDRSEAGVVARGGDGHVAHDVGEGAVRRHVAHAAPQRPRGLERDERAASLTHSRSVGKRRTLAPRERGPERLPRQPEQRGAIGGGELKHRDGTAPHAGSCRPGTTARTESRGPARAGRSDGTGSTPALRLAAPGPAAPRHRQSRT